MAFILGCENVSVEFPTKQVLREVSLGVETGQRIGIVGENGGGKSTLLSVLAGNITPDAGRVLHSGTPTVGMLGQTDALDDNASVETAIVGNVSSYEWASSARVRNIIDGLVSDIAWDAKVASLSGGQRRRVDLARVLIGNWDVLLLDEPTNHLDVATITWLATHLQNRWKRNSGALLVVTHDRWFLDEVCTNTWEVHAGGVNQFVGGFSEYVIKRVERVRLAKLAEAKRQNALRRELAWLARGPKARGTKPKFRVDAANELVSDVPPMRFELKLQRMAASRLSKQVIEFKNVTVKFDGSETPLLDEVDFSVGPADRIGIIGANGAGKTTFLKVAQGLIKPNSGRVKIGKTVQFAHLSQRLENLGEYENMRVREITSNYSRRVMLDGKETTPAKLLERLGFSRATLNEPVKDLSGGQKRRLALMLILLDAPNVLVLDEPGNDMDTDMLAAMEDLLDSWPSALLLVTHDRFLMERVTDNQYALIGGKLRHLPRGFDEYLKLCNSDASAQAQSKASANSRSHNNASPANVKAAEAGVNKLSGGEIKQLKKEMRSCENKLKTQRSKIEELKQEMQDTNPTDYEALAALQVEIDERAANVDVLETEWLEAASALEG